MPLNCYKALSLLIFILLSTASRAQENYTLKALFKTDTITWYGIDYSHATFSGDFIDGDMNKYFHQWNKLILDEPEKFDIGTALYKKVVFIDIACIEQRNKETPSIVNAASVPTDSLVTRSDISGMIQQYYGKRRQGFGIVFIAIRYDKIKNLGSHYIVIFDIASQKVLLTQKYEVVPEGFGIRNYWANSIYAAFKALPSNYKKWNKKHGE